jgi:hypothetical protein
VQNSLVVGKSAGIVAWQRFDADPYPAPDPTLKMGQINIGT